MPSDKMIDLASGSRSRRLLPSCSQAIIRASMHALRLLWEPIERARRAAKSKSDLLGLAEAPIKRRFLLA
jgi:hypothetical protein